MKTIDYLHNESVKAALYFLHSGDYCFRYKTDNGGIISKRISSSDVEAAITHSETDTGWMDAGIVRAGNNAAGKFFVYFKPAVRHTITLLQYKKLDFEFTIKIPPTVLIGTGTKYYLFCIASQTYAQREDAFTAPFPNVHQDGPICFGRHKVPEADHTAAESVWNLFFNSGFNADLVDRKSTAYPADVRAMLQKCDGMDYPISDLINTHWTIGDTVERKLKC